MLYFKHQELAAKYNVSLRTVHNWIEETRQGKLSLDLHIEKDRSYIANTARNNTAIEDLIAKRRKYRNTKAVKTVTPQLEFYSLFNEAQVYDIVHNLELYHEIPRQYNYFNNGAEHWEKYANRLAEEQAPNLLNQTVELLNDSTKYLDKLTSAYQKINVIDVGVGNAYPVKNLLNHLLDEGKLGRYIALDISPSILAIAEKNINQWFGKKIDFEGYEKDVTFERFSPILLDETLKEDTVNLVLLLGGTPHNLRSPDAMYKTIHDSMGKNDLLIYTSKLDTEVSRRYFDFNFDPATTTLSPNHKHIFDLFNIDPSFYEVEMGYDTGKYQRYIRVRFRINLTIKFNFRGQTHNLTFEKGDSILLWRYYQQSPQSVLEQFERNDFYTLHSSQTLDQAYILTVSQVKRD